MFWCTTGFILSVRVLVPLIFPGPHLLLADVCLESLGIILVDIVVSLQAGAIVFLLLSSPAAGVECQGFAQQSAREEKWGRIWAAACFPSVVLLMLFLQA